MTGVIIQYNNKEIAYELSYHYLLGKLFCITEKTKGNEKKYDFIRILLAKAKLSIFNSKIFNVNSLDDFMLINLFNNMLIY